MTQTRIRQTITGITIAAASALGVAAPTHADAPPSVINYGHCVAGGGVEPAPPGGPDEAPGISLIGPAGMAKAEPIYGDIIKQSQNIFNGFGNHFIGGVSCSKF